MIDPSFLTYAGPFPLILNTLILLICGAALVVRKPRITAAATLAIVGISALGLGIIAFSFGSVYRPPAEHYSAIDASEWAGEIVAISYSSALTLSGTATGLILLAIAALLGRKNPETPTTDS